MAADRPVRLALIGAGARGELNLATLAKRHPDLMEFVAVAEPLDARRERFRRVFDIPPENAFTDWRDLADRPGTADAVINALPCRMHYASSMALMDTGYHMLLEKPMALTPGESLALTDRAARLGLNLTIALQCRYNRIYSRVRQIADSGDLGELMNIDCAENIGYWHFILSYVRGIHHHSRMSHSFVMAKGIHDVDLVAWFAGAKAKKVASFGSLSFFVPENAPPGATDRCADGCPEADTCEYSAIRQYVDPGRPDLPYRLLTGMSLGAAKDFVVNPRFRSMASVVSPEDLSREGRLRAISETDFGKCVFRCENDIVDHQTVSIEFENGVVASFQLTGFSLIWERTLNLHGTAGEVRSADFSGRLQTRTYSPAKVSSERIRYHGIIHGGGDETILVEFARALAAGEEYTLTSARDTVESHMICFAAEEARKTGAVVEMADLRQRAQAEADELLAQA